MSPAAKRRLVQGELGLLVLLLSGCAVIPPLLDAVIGGVGIYQRWEDREAQKTQTGEIQKLREEIARLRESRAPSQEPE